MSSRIISFVVGLALVLAGYGWIAPHSLIGLRMAGLDLGPLTAQVTTLGALLIALGAVFAAAALLPGPNGPKRKHRAVAPIVPHELAPFGAAVATLAPTAEPPAATPVLASAAALAEEPKPFPAVDHAEAPPLETPVAEVASPAPDLASTADTFDNQDAVIEDAVVVSTTAEAPADAAVPPPAYKAPMESFEGLRARLHQLVRSESWTEAGQTARRLPALAVVDRERMLAAQDIGDMARAHGRLDDAAESYDQALSYARTMHAAAPSDPARATLLADALVNAGDMAQEHGQLDSAIVSYEEAVALRREAAAASPDSHALRVLSVTLERLADAREDRGHRMRALGLYKESHKIATQLAALNPARYCSDLAITEQRLSELQSRIDA